LVEGFEDFEVESEALALGAALVLIDTPAPRRGRRRRVRPYPLPRCRHVTVRPGLASCSLVARKVQRGVGERPIRRPVQRAAPTAAANGAGGGRTTRPTQCDPLLSRRAHRQSPTRHTRDQSGSTSCGHDRSRDRVRSDRRPTTRWRSPELARSTRLDSSGSYGQRPLSSRPAGPPRPHRSYRTQETPVVVHRDRPVYGHPPCTYIRSTARHCARAPKTIYVPRRRSAVRACRTGAARHRLSLSALIAAALDEYLATHGDQQ
jgi:hypothetical protein